MSRIGFVISTDRVGGGEVFLSRLATHLVSVDLEPILFGSIGSLQWPGQQLRVPGDSVKLSRRKRTKTMVHSALALPSTYRRIVQEHRQTPLRCFVLQYKKEQIALSRLLSRLAPVVWIEHGRLPTGRLFRSAYSRASSGASAIVAVAEPVAADLEGIVSNVVTVRTIRNGVDGSVFRPVSEGCRRRMRAELGLGAELVGVIASRLDRNKDLLWAVDLCARSGVSLLVCGEGEQQDRIRAAAEVRGVRASMLGWREDVRPYYQVADVSFHAEAAGEGLPLAMLEAAACGAVPLSDSRAKYLRQFVVAAGGADLVVDSIIVRERLEEGRAQALAWARGHELSVALRQYEAVFTGVVGP